jgi:hypothetical protein
MASSFQQQSLRRKILYTALIVCLFTVSLLIRQNGSYGIEAQADSLEIRERNLGDVELTGSALRLMTLGSSGLLEVVLWSQAQDLQMRNEWNDLEMIVNSVTKLQPHFITPWLFQSWNLAYNVSVESDRIRDKYFYIARGIQLLAEGERQNRGNPDMRYYIGFYNQHKIGLSDEANTERCLYEMSCIDPADRDPARLLKQDQTGARVVDMARFEQFCQEHPMLVRRLRETLKHDSPAEIVAFLSDNQKLPGRYVETTSGSPVEARARLRPIDKRFPCLPPLEPEDESDRADPDRVGFDCFEVARDWYTYSNKPLPPAEPEYTGVTPPYDPRKYRVPRYMASILFRGYPPRAQSYEAEHLEKDGWFDREGWKIAGWFPDDQFSNGKPAVVGDDVNWAERAWSKASTMWQEHGSRVGLYLRPEQMRDLNVAAEKYRKHYGVGPEERGPEPGPEDREEYFESFKAHGQLFWYQRQRMMTNFPHFYYSSQVESDPKAIEVRKAFFLADQQRKAGERELALETYRDAMPKWRDILLAHPDFRRDPVVQEDSYEIAVNYLEIARELYDKPGRQLLVFENQMAQLASTSPTFLSLLPYPYVSRRVPVGYVTPFDDEDDEGNLVIGAAGRQRYKERLGLPQLAEEIGPGDPLYRSSKPKKHVEQR